jgi:hypothetical protein
VGHEILGRSDLGTILAQPTVEMFLVKGQRALSIPSRRRTPNASTAGRAQGMQFGLNPLDCTYPLQEEYE